MEVVSQNFCGGTEENHRRTLNSNDYFQIKIQTGRSPNTNQKHYHGLLLCVHVVMLRHRGKLTFSSEAKCSYATSIIPTITVIFSKHSPFAS
jgi:hypothetical protein